MKNFLGRPLGLPKEMDAGNVDEAFDRKGGKEGIVIIQDAFSSYPARRSCARILVHFMEEYHWDLICVEGGSRDVSLGHMRARYTTPERRRMAEEKLRRGEMAAEEYVDLACDYQLLLWGVEDAELYRSNAAAQERIISHRAEPISGLSKAEALSISRLTHAGGEEMIGLLNLQDSYGRGDVSFTDYYTWRRTFARLPNGGPTSCGKTS